jgi:hypothetical protein
VLVLLHRGGGRRLACISDTRLWSTVVAFSVQLNKGEGDREVGRWAKLGWEWRRYPSVGAGQCGGLGQKEKRKDLGRLESLGPNRRRY